MKFRLATIGAVAFAFSQAADAAIISQNGNGVGGAVEPLGEDAFESQIIYQASKIRTTPQSVTIVSTLSTRESNKVNPGNIKTDTKNAPIIIPISKFTIPKAIYPVLTGQPDPFLDYTSTTLAAATPTTSSKMPGATGNGGDSGKSSPSGSGDRVPASSTAALRGIVAGGYYADQDIFRAIDTNAPPPVFSRVALNSVPLPTGVDSSGTIQTNKFYSNMIISDQSQPVYCLPYKLAFVRNSNNQGIAISYTDQSHRVFGPIDPTTNAAQYYINPVHLNSFIVGAKEFNQANTNLNVTKMDTLSAAAVLTGAPGSVNFPMLQGMGLVTAEYDGKLTPLIHSPLGVKTLAKRKRPVNGINGNIHEYRVVLGTGAAWTIFVTLPSSQSAFDFAVDGTSNALVGTTNEAVVIQIAYVPPSPGADNIYRKAAGMYPVSASLYGSVVDGNTASHGITYETKGTSKSGNPLIFALPHHLQGFVGAMSSRKVNITLDSTNKGAMFGYLTKSFDFSDTLPRDVMFLPWSSAPAYGKGLSYSADALKAIAASASSELQQDMAAQIMTDSTYYSGKGLDKFAYILLVVHDILQDRNATTFALGRIQSIFSNFTNNRQANPLIYDTVYKGITSSASLKNGDVNADFGSPVYSDHHFHYGYFVHAAAVVGYVDKALGGTWARDNAGWVNSLIRDVANPSRSDPHFPVSRYFDWYSGHSWAKGLFASADGKDQESSSEDYNFAYGMKLWGRVIGDTSMEARGDLMLAVMKRSLQHYFLMESTNVVEPNNFIGNKVPGITFENKLHHTTYFGNNIEYIQGIHMLPITPISSYFRTAEFAQQEWDQVLAGTVPSLSSGWLGIMRSNQALFDPKSAYKFFSSPDFKMQYLDGGASLTWYLAFSAGVGGSPA